MADCGSYFFLQIRLTVTAGYSGSLPELELLVWLRGLLPHAGKVLVVQPVEPIESVSQQTRTFQARQLNLPAERLAPLVDRLKSLGFPPRLPEIEDSGDPESIWWAHAALEISMNDDSGRLEFGFGPDGLRGPDSASLREILRVLFECAGVRSPWSDLLLPAVL